MLRYDLRGKVSLGRLSDFPEIVRLPAYILPLAGTKGA
jgi:hypothetical protein